MVDFKKLSMLSNISRDIVNKEHPSFDENRKRVFCLGFLGGFNYSEKNPDANRETIDAVSRDGMNRSNPWYEEYEKETYLLGFNRGYSYVANDEARHYKQYMENPFSDQIGLGETTPDYDSADAAGLGVQFPILLKGTIIGWLPIDAIYDKDKPNHLISDDNRYLRMSSVGDSAEIKKEYRGQGYGKAAYYELAVKAARMGMTLCSAPDSSRSENANSLWKSLVSSGYARQNGDRYEFINSKLIVTNKTVGGGIQTASTIMTKISEVINSLNDIKKNFGDVAVGTPELGVRDNDAWRINVAMNDDHKVYATLESYPCDENQDKKYQRTVSEIVNRLSGIMEKHGDIPVSTPEIDPYDEDYFNWDISAKMDDDNNCEITMDFNANKKTLKEKNENKIKDFEDQLDAIEAGLSDSKDVNKLEEMALAAAKPHGYDPAAKQVFENGYVKGANAMLEAIEEILDRNKQAYNYSKDYYINIDVFKQRIDELKDKKPAVSEEAASEKALKPDNRFSDEMQEAKAKLFATILEAQKDLGDVFSIAPTEISENGDKHVITEILPDFESPFEDQNIIGGVSHSGDEDCVHNLALCLENVNDAEALGKAVHEAHVQHLEQGAKQAIHDRIVTPSARVFTPEQVGVLNRYHQVATPDTPANEAFSRLLDEVAQEPDVARKSEKWVADTANELDGIAEGITREQDQGLKR